jgi:hypothetical protein
MSDDNWPFYKKRITQIKLSKLFCIFIHDCEHLTYTIPLKKFYSVIINIVQITKLNKYILLLRTLCGVLLLFAQAFYHINLAYRSHAKVSVIRGQSYKTQENGKSDQIQYSSSIISDQYLRIKICVIKRFCLLYKIKDLSMAINES